MSDSVGESISFAHALTKHLLHVQEEDAQNIIIAVLPRNGAWVVQVSYSGFLLAEEAPKLSEALGKVVDGLAARVMKQLEEGTKLLSKPET